MVIILVIPEPPHRDPGWEKFRIRIRDEQPGSYFRELGNKFWGFKYFNSLMKIRDPQILKFFDADPGSAYT
jgi:hypothetical protein